MNLPTAHATGTRLLTRGDVAALMSPQDYLDAVRDGFAALAQGRAVAPEPLYVAAAHGGFHAKAASYQAAQNKPARSFVALKFNANMPGNGAMFDLPTIQGALLLCDADNGQLLGVMDSIELTLRRTAAATALAAQHLAKPDAATLAVCGCGAQALPHIETLLAVLPLRRIRLWDIDNAKSRALCDVLVARGGLDVTAAASVRAATSGADVIVTCTTSRTAMRVDQVHAELGALVNGTRPGRCGHDEICIFDSTGVAVQDVATAALVYSRANERGVGALVDFALIGPAQL